jgi:mono/diheme cytochrome c family protein
MGQAPLTVNRLIGAFALALVIAQPAAAQKASEQGQDLYEQHCALCHQDSGAGTPPLFPALNGNTQLGNIPRVVRSIREGTSRMPPFPALPPEAVASLATYIRTAWANDFGGVTTAGAATVIDGLGEAGPMASVWDGVFTAAQAERGQAVYAETCAICHGHRLNGASDDPDMRSTPPLARARFIRVWTDRSLATLFEYTRATMPEDNPDSLTSQETVDAIAYLLSVSGIPAGDNELPADMRQLARAVIAPQP